MTLLISKTKEDWTFKEIKTQEFTHGLPQYPARMHPEIAKRLITKFTSKKSDLVFDPHVFFANNIFHCFLITALMYTVVIFRSDTLKKRYAIGYGLFFI